MSILIHATNINGLGAIQVVKSVLPPIFNYFQNESILCYLPENKNDFPENLNSCNYQINYFKRNLPNSISRFSECVFSRFYFKKADKILVLGDIPLSGFNNQVVLVHQPNLVKPKFDIHTGKGLKFCVERLLFNKNKKNVKSFVVQTKPMKDALSFSFNIPKYKIHVIPQPPPNWFTKKTKTVHNTSNDCITLFYPAANYPHKNHAILDKMDDYIQSLNFKVEIVITLDPRDVPFTSYNKPWIKFIGRLSPEECLAQYRKSHALFFPSFLESYGLPLVEAMILGLPIICSDYPYARWVCEDEAIYFDPQSGRSAANAVKSLYHKMSANLYVDWTKSLAKLPKSWDDVAHKIGELL